MKQEDKEPASNCSGVQRFFCSDTGVSGEMVSSSAKPGDRRNPLLFSFQDKCTS